MGSKRKRSAQEAPALQPPAKKQQKPSQKPAPKPLELDCSPFVDNPKGPELKREVELYEILGSEDDRSYLVAANAIVSGLLGDGGVEESTLQRHLERRLFRGLASGRNAARRGYGTVLAEIISQLFGDKGLARTKYAGLTYEKVMGFLLAKTKPDGDLSGQEVKDHFFGLLFGLKAFVRANVLFEDEKRWFAVLDQLVELENKKPWIREQVGLVIVEALAQMSHEQVEETLNRVYNAGLAITPEGVAIWLVAKARFPDYRGPPKPWGLSGNPLDRLQSLAKALKESYTSDEGVKQPGNWNQKLNHAWSIVLNQFADAVKNKKHGISSDFENFWKVAVDENLFSATASNERKCWGFLLFQEVIQQPDKFRKVFPSIFSRNLTRSLVNHLQTKDRYLNGAAEKSLKVMIRTVEADSKNLPVVLQGLLSASYNFDRITKTKTVEKLLTSLNENNADKTIEALAKGALTVESSDAAKEAEIRRTMLGDYLLKVVRKVRVADGSKCPNWVEKTALSILAGVAYGTNIFCTPTLSEKTRVLFRNRLMSSFEHLVTSLGGFVYPCEIVQITVPDAVQMDEEITKASKNALSTMSGILKKEKKATSEEKPMLQALALIYSLAIFQLYNGESEAISVLDELKLCYDKLVRHKDTEDSDMEASEVLVQLLLSFLSKPSALLRKVSQHVFQAFIGDITSGGLKLITEVLESGESLRGQQDLFDQEPDDEDIMDEDEDEDEENDDDELDSDVEVVDLKGLPARMGHLKPHLDDSDDDADADSEEDEDEEDDTAAEDDDEVKKLEAALAAALGTHRLDQDNDAQESDSDADMTDSEMMAMDSKLEEIFSQRKKIPNKKKEQKDAKEMMINFKSRVLDLLDIYVKKQASNPLAFDLLIPLLQLMRTTKTTQLREKAREVISSFAKSAKKGTPVDIAVPDQIEIMKTIHLEASKDPSQSFSKAASGASLILASNIYRADKENFNEIAILYMGTQVAWVEKVFKMHASFFQEYINFSQSLASS